jgi:hypothetical protein
VFLIERDRVSSGWIDPIDIALARHRSNHCRAAPARKLRSHGADAAQDALNQDRLACDRPVGKHRR